MAKGVNAGRNSVMAEQEGPVLVGAEAWESAGTNGANVLVLHGFTGSPISMRPLAEAFAAAGFAVSMPRLPGHGTVVEDMIPTRWEDWIGHARAAYDALAARRGPIVVAGLSMGGTLTVALGLDHPNTAGLVLVNPAVEPMAEEFRVLLGQMAEVSETMPAIGDDIAKPGVSERSYDATPIKALLSLAEAGDELAARLGELRMPVLLCASPQDHVVPPTAPDYFCARVSASVERVVLERSFHVATLDHDAPLIESSAVAFARRVCGLG
jgi:carboxylesterase